MMKWTFEIEKTSIFNIIYLYISRFCSKIESKQTIFCTQICSLIIFSTKPTHNLKTFYALQIIT